MCNLAIREDWRVSFSGYLISSVGRIYSFYVKRFRRVSPNNHGYLVILMNGKMHGIHRLVAFAFIPNEQNKPAINHINGDKLDNRVENLEWMTTQENCLHSVRVLKRNSCCGRKPKGIRLIHPNGDICEYGSISEGARAIGCNDTAIHASKRRGQDKVFGIKFEFV